MKTVFYIFVSLVLSIFSLNLKIEQEPFLEPKDSLTEAVNANKNEETQIENQKLIEGAVTENKDEKEISLENQNPQPKKISEEEKRKEEERLNKIINNKNELKKILYDEKIRNLENDLKENKKQLKRKLDEIMNEFKQKDNEIKTKSDKDYKNLVDNLEEETRKEIEKVIIN